MTDNVSRFASPLDKLRPDTPGEQDTEFDAGNPEYAAFWENPAKARTVETTVLLWDKHGNAHGVDYPLMRHLDFVNGTITFIYDGYKYTLKGSTLRNLYVRISDQKPKHLREYNPDLHDSVPEDQPCIEEMKVEEI